MNTITSCAGGRVGETNSKWVSIWNLPTVFWDSQLCLCHSQNTLLGCKSTNSVSWSCQQKQDCSSLCGLQCLCSCTANQIGKVICLENNLFFLFLGCFSAESNCTAAWWTDQQTNVLVHRNGFRGMNEWNSGGSQDYCVRGNTILKYLLNFSHSSNKNICLFSVEK